MGRLWHNQGLMLFGLLTAVALTVLLIVGDIAAVTLWIPSTHPTLLVTVALYTCFVWANGLAVGFIAYGPLADFLGL